MAHCFSELSMIAFEMSAIALKTHSGRFQIALITIAVLMIAFKVSAIAIEMDLWQF
jgi:hypothetical protein